MIDFLILTMNNVVKIFWAIFIRCPFLAVGLNEFKYFNTFSFVT